MTNPKIVGLVIGVLSGSSPNDWSRQAISGHSAPRPDRRRPQMRCAKSRLQRRGNSNDDPFVRDAHPFTLDLGPYPIHGLRRTLGH
jgi:hypothetical protein